MHRPCLRGSSSARAGAAVCWLGLLVLMGCSSSSRPWLDKLVPVQGKITRADGKPLSGGRVTFTLIDSDSSTPKKSETSAPTPVPIGSIGEDGSYTLSTEGKPGAPPGKYRVMLTPPPDKKVALEVRAAVAQQYFSRKSPLEVEVAENKPAGGYDLKLQSRQQSRKGNPPGKRR
jgi:hypothetical protein